MFSNAWLRLQLGSITLFWLSTNCQNLTVKGTETNNQITPIGAANSSVTKVLDSVPDVLKMFISGYGKSIMAYNFDTKKGTFTLTGITSDLGANPSWLTLDRSKKILISTHEVGDFESKNKTGGVVTSTILPDGTLKKISTGLTPENPVSSEFSLDQGLVVVASYTGGSLSTFSVDPTGKLSPQPLQTFFFKGSGPVKDRQTAAFAHQARFVPGGNLVLVPDLGSDRMHVFLLGTSNQLTAGDDIIFKEGSGPRHLEFGRSNSGVLLIYVVLELSNELSIFEILPDSKKPKFIEKQTVSTLPKNSNKTSFNAAEVSITPDGKFVYVTNRQKDPQGRLDDNTFAIFPRDSVTGLLKPPTFAPTGGKGPRQFSFSPDKIASFIMVACQDSNLVIVHRRNTTSGELSMMAAVPVEAPTMILLRN
ncbi:hypothetical protein CROQUDRAFT_46952 [Cronartium quercuum f. sp. fusiforme G11]|uniref:6-phosphogluconolactonase n=1 Tax=Cronartium quercuum f. sp. fusiforme G11 TaxID=708437 RepID=A0A9P6NDG6_9BASI|nr:hypothetical protein CROQUDRAFT_46952 [Cronartium quercuum f. sp. fusiforme G11]